MGAVKLILLVILSIFWTAVTIVRMIIDYIRNRDTFFVVKKRSMPEVLTKGWQHGYVTLSEVKLHYVTAGSPSKPLMLMVHGFPEFWYSWRSQIEAFKSDYRVVAIDLRGYNQSDKPKGIYNYTIEKLSKDIKEVVTALGYKSCTLVAHDWGGAISWRTTATYPEVVEKLIICNCPHPKAFAELLDQGSVKQLLKSWYMFFFQCPYLPELYLRSNDFKFFDLIFTNYKLGGCKNPNAFKPEDIEAWKYVFSQPGALTPIINYYRSAMRQRAMEPESNDPLIIEQPTLVIWGTNDIALSKELGALSVEKYCSNGTIRYVEGASHWVQQDAPDLCIKYMKEFLKI